MRGAVGLVARLQLGRVPRDRPRALHRAGLAVIACGLLVAASGCNADHHSDSRSSSAATGSGMPGKGAAGAGASSGPAICADHDGDGIADDVEGPGDQDRDGHPNGDDTDSDGDGIDDSLERGASPCVQPPDSDRDGTPDFLDTDSDGDGQPDTGGAVDLDRDGDPDFRDSDDDGDGIADVTELGRDPSHPVDTDGDGTPDFHDLDSDGDGIADRATGASADADKDGVLDYLDDDSDGDGIADAFEVGSDPATPRDTDNDGMPDYLDADSDGDGLHDGLEDANGNGMLDHGESDPQQVDTDGDGAADLIEATAGTDPSDKAVNPQSEGNFVFVVPYQQPPMPPNATLDFATDLRRADVVFSLDTTGSMDGELVQLRSDLRTKIIPMLAAKIPDLGFGVANFEDFPVFPFGDGADEPIHLVTPVTTDPATAQAGIDQLQLGSGGDGPEAGNEALYQLATGAGVEWPGGKLEPFAVGWRTGALPIIVQITDAAMNAADTYGTSVPMAATRAATTDALKALGARMIAVVSADGDLAGATREYLQVVTATGATVPPAAFGSSGQCATGGNGVSDPPDASGNCPLLFHIDGQGQGLGTSIVDAVSALADFATLDIDARAQNEDGNMDANGDPLDAVDAFLDRVVPNANPSATVMCTKGLTVEDRLGNDGLDDTFVDVPPGKPVCFDVVAKQNDRVQPQPYPQLFRARIDLYGDGVTTLDSRQVWFLVPPKPPEPGEPPCSGLNDPDCNLHGGP